MDCHSPGEGLMPASFKVRTVQLDCDDSATEELLDPDFGEAAIGRVAPVDSGWLISFSLVVWTIWACIIDIVTLLLRFVVDHIVTCIWVMLWRHCSPGKN